MDRTVGLDSSASGQGPVVGPCEHGNEASVSIKGGGISQKGLCSMELVT
jgi:hypothetical protein